MAPFVARRWPPTFAPRPKPFHRGTSRYKPCRATSGADIDIKISGKKQLAWGTAVARLLVGDQSAEQRQAHDVAHENAFVGKDPVAALIFHEVSSSPMNGDHLPVVIEDRRAA